MRCTVVLLGLVLIFLIQSSSAGAQIQIGTIKGTVTDQAGALAPNAGVTLENLLTDFTAQLLRHHKATMSSTMFHSIPIHCESALQASNLFGSPFDTPLFASQDRRDVRQGMIANLTRSLHGHTLKTGFEVSRLSLREFFTFAVTDRAAAQAREVSDAALEFDPGHPFVFRDRRIRGQFSGYIQDTFSPLKSLTIDAGLRYDHSSLLASDQQFSPRVGAVYYIHRTKTAVRGSFNRLYMPPQIENLLLSSSEQARSLSPFAAAAGGGGMIRTS